MLTDPVSVSESAIYEYDLLARASFVGHLKDILVGGDKGIVLGLNGAWGTGKSTAINFLEQELKNSGHAVLVLNAWADDYVSDPLIAIISSLVDDENFKTLIADQELINRLATIGKNVIEFATSLAISRLSRGQLSRDDILGISEVATDHSDILRQYAQEKASLSELRKILVEISEKLIENDDKKLIIIIDELDRCKPTYAVALFERIKHLLEIDNLRVLLSFDQNQLEATVKKHYGAEIDANRYLEKMFDLIVNLPSADLGKLLAKTANTLELHGFRVSGLSASRSDNVNEFLGMLLTLLTAMDSSARELERTLTRIKFLLGRENGLNVDPVFAIVLLILKNQKPKLFDQIKNEESTFLEIDKVFKSNASKSKFWIGSYSNYVETLYYIKQDSKQDQVDLTHIAINSQAFEELPDNLKLKRQRMQAYIEDIRTDRFGSLSGMAHSVEFVIS